MIDSKDIKILEILRNNSRTKVRNIAKKLKIPITTVHKRIRKMEEDGIIIGYATNVDYEKLGFSISAYVHISADYVVLKKKNMSQEFFVSNILNKISEISIASVVTGHDRDFILRLRAKNIDDLNRIIGDLRKVDGVLTTDTSIILCEAKQSASVQDNL